MFAYTGCLAHERIEVEDTAVAAIRFENGALGTIQGTTAAFPGVSTRLQVHGDRGSIVIENDELIYIHTTGSERAESFTGATTQDNQLAQYVSTDTPAAKTAASDPRQLSDAHRYQYENFLAALAGRAELPVSLEEARLALALTLSTYESARTGRPVTVSSS